MEEVEPKIPSLLSTAETCPRTISTQVILPSISSESVFLISGLPHSDEPIELKEKSRQDLWLLLSGQLSSQDWSLAVESTIDGFIDWPNKDDCPSLLTGDVEKPCDIDLAFRETCDTIVIAYLL